MDCELLSPWAKKHKDPPPHSSNLCKSGCYEGGGGGSGGGVLPQKIMNLVDVISRILVHLGDGQLALASTLVSSDS